MQGRPEAEGPANGEADTSHARAYRRQSALSQPGALEAELAAVDLRRELRHAGLQQFWIAVPIAVAVFAVFAVVRP
jgi:hypothetical protein